MAPFGALDGAISHWLLTPFLLHSLYKVFDSLMSCFYSVFLMFYVSVLFIQIFSVNSIITVDFRMYLQIRKNVNAEMYLSSLAVVTNVEIIGLQP